MGSPRQNPRYNVFPFRASDQEAQEIMGHVPAGRRATFFRDAVLEKIRREKQKRMDDALSSRQKKVDHALSQ